jgi:hypothetical protein
VPPGERPYLAGEDQEQLKREFDSAGSSSSILLTEFSPTRQKAFSTLTGKSSTASTPPLTVSRVPPEEIGGLR